MSDITRRDFLAASALLSSGLGLGPFNSAHAAARTAPPKVALSWLGDQPPRLPAGVAWGVPWPRGSVAAKATLVVRDAAGAAVPAQSWPLAYWPDGSLKWSGLAVAANAQSKGLTVAVGGKNTPLPKSPVTVKDGADSVTITTGPLTATLNKSGQSLIASLASDGRTVAREGRLIAVRQDRSQYEDQGLLREEYYLSRIDKLTVEQYGPVRAVVRVDGVHAATAGSERQWLPFTVRLYFTAGLNSIRVVHSFVFDGDQNADFIKGIGIAFSVPFREETQNRHVRFATGDSNLFAEPVLMMPGYRPKAMQNAAEYQRAQIAGQRVPQLAELPETDRANLATTATWDSFKLNQLEADAWSLHKRTNVKSSWLHITSGNRARGLAFLGDVSGGLAVGVKHFWQKNPAAFEISGGAAETGELKAWFWSPDAPAMDLRHYDTVMHSLEVTYEDARDFKRANAYGCANTTELTLWATPDTPSAETLNAMTQDGNEPPLLICAPQHYYDTQALGYWSLPNTPTPGLSTAELASAETQLDRGFAFYAGEVERRRWYGFWDFGDWRRTYDPIRHQWMYDIGGHGWNATELMPDIWLWFAFLRSGRADIFRAAETMTRNTSEVDVYHLGPYAGVGSRHNVSHWGDGAKEGRISQAYQKRAHHYLTTDERSGDLMREVLGNMEQFYVNDTQHPNVKPPKAYIRIGPDWLALASNWLVEWERTGNNKYRELLLTGMRDMGNMAEAVRLHAAFEFDPASGHLRDVGEPAAPPSQFMFLFAGDQIVHELRALIDCPEFGRAWDGVCEDFMTNGRANWYFEPRITAHAANTTGRQDLEDRALQLYRDLLRFGDEDYFVAKPQSIDGPGVTQAGLENPGRSTFTPALAIPEVAQWALNLITAPELIRAFKPNNKP